MSDERTTNRTTIRSLLPVAVAGFAVGAIGAALDGRPLGHAYLLAQAALLVGFFLGKVG